MSGNLYAAFILSVEENGGVQFASSIDHNQGVPQLF